MTTESKIRATLHKCAKLIDEAMDDEDYNAHLVVAIPTDDSYDTIAAMQGDPEILAQMLIMQLQELAKEANIELHVINKNKTEH